MVEFIKKNKIRIWVALHDLFVTLIALYATLVLRFDGSELVRSGNIVVYYIPLFALYAGVVYALFSLYSAKWRFASMPDLFNISKAVTVLCASLLVIDYVIVSSNIIESIVIGKKAIIIYALLQTALLGMSRLYYRYYKMLHMKSSRSENDNILVVGKGRDVELVSRGIEVGLLKGNILGFISPLDHDVGTKIRGHKSLGRPHNIEDILLDLKVRGIKITQAIVVPDVLRNDDQGGKLLGALRKNNIAIKSFTLEDSEKNNGVIESKNFERVKDEEMLLRSLVKVDTAPIKSLVSGKKVMITGGGGSIGSEITMQVAKLGASEIIIVENSEPALYSILERLELEGLLGRAKGIICDIRDLDRVKAVFEETKPHLVYHAAALKQVPYLEVAPIEAFKTNTLGTKNVADCAKTSGVEAFVLISTDKATRPTSVLGATKRLAELYVQMVDSEIHHSKKNQRLIAVRFGNVLGTSGSVVPRFAKQIAEGGPVTVTHKDMVRFFMTVKEATSLVLTSSSHALKDKTKLAAIYVLNMGQPVHIYELAERMIRMAGFEPHKDIIINEIGVRPGERLNEELFHSDEPEVEIGIGGVVAAQKGELTSAFLIRIIDELEKLSKTQDQEAVRLRLQAVVPGYHPSKIVGHTKAIKPHSVSTKIEKRLTN